MTPPPSPAETAERDLAMLRLALEEAARAADEGEVPVGCIIASADGQVIGRGRNRREADADPTAHAEVEAIRQAARAVGGWRLEGTTCYVTLEPCPMCAGALVNARVARLVYGCDDPKAGAVRTLYSLCEDPRLNHRLEVVAGLHAEECADALRRFFQALRARRR